MTNPLSYNLKIDSFIDKIRQLSIQYKNTNRVFGFLTRKELKASALDVVELAKVNGITPDQLWLECDGAFQEMNFRPEEIGIE
ncbi:hypothetical protein [Chitinophaga pinensis]|uniref:Uncharacterized protein n=1 Tax=Chitinophaga pinensis (strain ATCC 43595 / DSM 2588 / LMG 13176 / NBRC 15968 / NCIMB 11800 / UQM 2034) TaxID=485918 RepID=A0A979G5T3_CHIPD|nr:hypothetical protein [Chitinophaga pinensis]ACU61332.1 hypothetical protein Cpin_3870 [Chitinophaga pinensis DSM 2588]